MKKAHINHLESVFITATMAEGRDYRCPAGWTGKLIEKLEECYVRLAFTESDIPWK